MGTIVADENFLLIVGDHTIGKFQVLGAAKFLHDISHQIKNDDAHHFALDHHHSPLVVNCHSAGVLQNIGAKLAQKLAVLVVNLDLMRGTALSHHNIACGFVDSDS